MAKYLIYLILLFPLSGVWFMEQGVISLSSYEIGYPNGALKMFLLYIALVLSGFFLVVKLRILRVPLKIRFLEGVNLEHASFIALLLNIVILFVILFGFGSINVLLGHVGKGDFRVNLGVLGFVAMGITRWTCPALLAFSTFIYTKRKRKALKNKGLLLLHFLVCSFMAASWGFKSFAITILIPSLIILYWDIKIWKLAFFGVLAACSFIFFATVFDGAHVDLAGFAEKDELFKRLNDDNAITAVLYRATVLQGDVSWIMWERYTSGVEFPTYWWNLLAAFGNNISGLFLSSEEITYYNYINQLTAISTKRSVYSLDGSYNVTGTVFSEGIMMGGVKGLIGLSLFAGLFVGFFYKLILHSINRNRIVIASISSVYYFKIFTWLNGGNMIGLFHFSYIVFIIITILTLEIILLLSRKKRIMTISSL